MENLRYSQQKRIVMLSSAALVFGAYALFTLSGNIFPNGKFIGFGAESNEIYLASSCILMIMSVVYILISAFVANRHLNYLEKHDKVTGLPNITHLFENLSKDSTKDNSLAIIIIHNNRLKSVNNFLGEGADEHILEQFSKRVSSITGTNKILTSMGDGMMGLYFPHVGDKTEVYDVADTIFGLAKMPIVVDDRKIFLGVTMGAAMLSGYSPSPNELLRRAEIAITKASEQESDHLIFFDEKMDEFAREQSTLEAELREVLEDELMIPFFQPLIKDDCKTLMGFEALARWKHPERGYISPANFIPIVESLGLAEKMGNLILRKSCALIQPLGELIVCVNISPKHFLVEGFVEEVFDILVKTNMPAKRLEIEITESVLLDDPDKAISTISRLRELGVSIALDDFGTGYSGLSYLTKFEVDRIKVDSSFVSELENSSASRSLISTIVKLGQGQGSKITVEGIENKAQLEFLQQFDDLWYQGFYFAKPMDYPELLSSKYMENLDINKFESLCKISAKIVHEELVAKAA